MRLNAGKVSIFDLRNMKVCELQNGSVKHTVNGVIVWDGKGEDGSLVKPGVYLYLITADGEVLCNGTIYIVR